MPALGGEPGLITTVYLDAAEYAALERVPARILHKTRISVPPLGVDVFEGLLDGLVLGEAEFDDDDHLVRFVPPPIVVAEVTRDHRLTGGELAIATRHDIKAILAEYGVRPRDR